jgi:hypothetical protein
LLHDLGHYECTASLAYARSGPEATLSELGPSFGLSRLDSVSNLVRHAAQRSSESRTWKREEDVDPVSFLLGSAAGWGGNPPHAAIYVPVFPRASDVTTSHRLNV